MEIKTNFDTSPFVQAVNDLIAENHNTYKSHSRITSDYRGERGLTEAYNGRQLLEMLQNADDAHTDKVLIQLDIENNILTIANNGIPFDIKGLGSLMLANNSPKNKRDFIGNKGLGFRSILNWVNVVKIKTKTCVLEFSKEIAKREFEKLIPDIETRNQIIENEKDLPKGDLPMAVLAIPDFKENSETQVWETIVELKYKKSEESKIIEQLDSITPKVLLFLNHTTSIQIIGVGDTDKELVLTPSRDQIENKLSINDITWNLFDSGEQSLPNNKEKFYKYKIAWQNDLSDKETRFASYFPTQVAIHLPYLIHATFDLDPTRNHLNKSEDNYYILNQIAETLNHIAITKIVNKDNPDWKALDFLTVEGKSENRLLDSFFQSIENAKAELAIYPTVDGYYKAISEVKYYGNEFSEWVRNNKLEEHFPNLILPIPSNRTLIKQKIISKYTIEEWKSIFEVTTSKIKNIEERVKLIKLLATDSFKDFHGIHLPLLLDDKGKPVASNFETFILKKADADSYQIPSYVTIAFIDNEFYTKLENAFNEEIEKIRTNTNEHKSRSLKKIIFSVVNFGSNDITDVVRNITRAFNNKVEEDESKANELVKPFINSLYQIFKQKKDREKTTVDNIQVLNREGNLVLASDTFLGKEYYFGKTTEKLFEGIFIDSQYLIGNGFWNLDIKNQSTEYLDNFFIWLGVNKYSKQKNIKKTVNQWGGFDQFTKFVFNKIGTPNLCTYVYYDIEEIEYFDALVSKKMEIERLIAWIILDKKIFNKIDYETNNETFTYSYSNNTRTLVSKPSYFLYQITKSKALENIFVDFEFADFLGMKSINPKHQIFTEFSIADTTVIDTLRKLGAKMSFNDITCEEVYKLLDSLKNKNIDHKNARKIYLQAFSYFRSNKEIDSRSIKKQTHLLAFKNDKREYKPTQEVYYSDNTTLPSKIIEDFWIFDFPKRSGEKQLAEYFGLNTFKDIKIDILEKNIETHPKAEEFTCWVDKIKPYLLTYRLNNIKTVELINTAVHAIKNCSIIIVSSLEYTIKDSEPKILLPNEFINNDKQKFFIGADFKLNLEQLKDTPAFCEAFSEILCVLFEVNENKDDFRAIFKDKEHLKDTKYLIQTKMLSDRYEDSCQKLGLSKNEILFWKAITEGKIDHFPEIISNTKQLERIIFAIDYKLPDYYGAVNFDTFNNQPSFNFINAICSSQNISLSEIKTRHNSFPGLKNYHLDRYKQTAIGLEIFWNKACWIMLSVKSIKEQETFESKRNLYTQKRQELVEKLVEQHSWTIQVDYEKELINLLFTEFKIRIQKKELAKINLEYKYQDLLSKYNINPEELGTDLKSLLFFDGHYIEIETRFAKLKKEEVDNKESSNDEAVGKESVSAIITSIGLGNAPSNSLSSGFGNKKGITHSQKREYQNKKAGKRAEKLVWEKLKELYPKGEIRWISGNSEDNSLSLDDTKGYDISYKKNITDDQWKYLEVKSCSNGSSFIISAKEVNVGIENKENYHLALVNGVNITFVEDFFLNELRLAEFNVLRNSASIRPLDYEVYFKFDKIDESTMI